jgi:hypothetical protein
VEKLIPTKDDMKPTDPVSENQHALTLKPLKAFAYQDHEAHIQVHMMAMRDPLIQQIIGQNPQAQQIQAAMMAHISEHVGYAYRNKMSTALGAPLPSDDTELSAEMEYQLSKLLAQAAPQVMAQSQAIVGQQQAQRNQQDPLIQMQQQELQLKQQEVERKAKKDMMDAAAKADEIKLKEQDLQIKQMVEGTKLGIQVAADKSKAEREDQKEGIRIGADIAKHRAQMFQQRRQAQNKSRYR